MNKDEKDLVQKLGEIISVDKICYSNIKNVLEGEFSYNNKKIKVYSEELGWILIFHMDNR